MNLLQRIIIVALAPILAAFFVFLGTTRQEAPSEAPTPSPDCVEEPCPPADRREERRSRRDSFRERFFPRRERQRTSEAPPTAPRTSTTVVPTRSGLLTATNIRYGSDPNHVLDVFYNKGFTGAPIAVLVHGGGWTEGRKEKLQPLASFFHDLGFVVVTPNYRLSSSGANTFPVPVNDVACATAWIQQNAGTYGADGSTIVIGGHSAGAQIAAMLAYNPERNWLLGCGASGPQPTYDGFLGSSGPYDFDLVPAGRTTHVKTYLGNLYGPGKWNEAEPINFVTPGDPKTLLITGDNDGFVNDQNTLSLAAAAQAKGIPVTLNVIPGYNHRDPLLNFTSNPTIREAAIEFLQQF